jgi:Putative Actinobacterial Holin-X, holin superfamily III
VALTDDSASSTGPADQGPAAPLPQLVTELWELVVAYFKQETVVPLKQLGRYIALGIAGSLLLGLGVLFLALAGLRALQTETGDAFDGNWSWAPYAIVLGGLLIAALITWKARGPERVRRST